MNRTKNATRNLIFGFINKIIVLLFPFIIRSVMIKTLGSEYLGLNSLFVSILQVLNLAELGFNSAIVYSMYRPIAEKDAKTICALMNLYKKIYRIIGIIVITIGLILLPFLKILIHGTYPSEINIYIIYLIYLFNTGITYFLFAYKSALIVAHQRSDVISNVQSITYILQYGMQLYVLLKMKNYYLFTIVQIFTTILNNIVIAVLTNRKYPQYECNGLIDENLKKDIRKKVFGLFINKICQTTRNSLDSICISAFLGLNIVAMYNNYYSVIHAIIGMMGIITTSITAGVGNSIVTEKIEKNYDDMNKFNFIFMWLSGVCTICLACLFQPFMKMWMGNEYLFSYDVVILICAYFYALEMGVIRAIYSDAKGLWYENRYRAIAESITNVLLNIILSRYFGIYGIILGTLISLLVINFGYGSQILFKHYFVDQKISDYYKKHGTYACVTIGICLITFYLCSFIKIEGFFEIVIKLLVCLIVPNVLYFLVYFKRKIFKESLELIHKIPVLNKLTGIFFK